MSDTLGPDARSLLLAAQGGDDPSAEDAVRVRAGLALRLGTLAAVSAAGAAGTLGAKGAAVAGGASSLAAGATGATGVAGAAAATAAAGTAIGTTAAVTGTVGAFSAKVVGMVLVALATTGAVVVATRVSATGETDVRKASSTVGSVADSPSIASARAPTCVLAVSASATVSASASAPASVSVPASVPVSVSASPSANRANRADNTERPREAERAARAQAATPAPTSADPILEEASLLRAARSAIVHGDGRAANATLDEHVRRFPQGALTEERNAARVLALCAEGRTDAARVASQLFLAASPRSPLASAVASSCVAPRASNANGTPSTDAAVRAVAPAAGRNDD